MLPELLTRPLILGHPLADASVSTTTSGVGLAILGMIMLVPFRHVIHQANSDLNHSFRCTQWSCLRGFAAESIMRRRNARPGIALHVCVNQPMRDRSSLFLHSFLHPALLGLLHLTGGESGCPCAGASILVCTEFFCISLCSILYTSRSIFSAASPCWANSLLRTLSCIAAICSFCQQGMPAHCGGPHRPLMPPPSGTIPGKYLHWHFVRLGKIRVFRFSGPRLLY